MLEKAGGRAGHFLEVQRRFGIRVTAVGELSALAGGGDNGDVLVTEKAGLFEDELGVCIDLVLAVYPQRDGDVGALWAELQAGYRADLHRSEERRVGKECRS